MKLPSLTLLVFSLIALLLTTWQPVSAIEIEFLSAEAGGNAIVGGEDDEFFAKLYPREAAAMTGVPRGEKTKEQSRVAAREFFRQAILDFTEEERTALTTVATRVEEKFGDDYPLLVRKPWRFIKTRRDLCGGFSFTRGTCIVLSEPTLARIITASQVPAQRKSPAESLLLHEQMHILQRQQPELLEPLYEQLFGFRAANVKVDPWIDERQVSNPDGLSDNWVAQVREDGEQRPYWIGTLLLEDKPLHRMGRDFSTVAVPLKKNESGVYEMLLEENVPRFRPLDELTSFTARLPIRGGYDHPNEVAAYLLTVITHNELRAPPKGEAAEVLSAAKEWFQTNLKSASKDHKTDEAAQQPAPAHSGNR